MVNLFLRFKDHSEQVFFRAVRRKKSMQENLPPHPCLDASKDQRSCLAREAQDASSPGEESLSQEGLFPLCPSTRRFRMERNHL